MTIPNKPFWLSSAGSEAGVSKPFWMSNGTIRALAGAGIPYWVSSLAGKSAVQPSVTITSGNQSSSGNAGSKTFGCSAQVNNGSASAWSWSVDYGSISSGQGSANVNVTMNVDSQDTEQATVTATATVNGQSYSASCSLTYSNTGGCVALDSWFPDGAQAVSVGVGHRLRALDYDTMTSTRDVAIQRYAANVQDSVRITSASGITLVASKTTPVTYRDRSTSLITECAGRELFVEDSEGSRWERIVSVEDVGEREVALIFAGHATFAAGERRDAFIYTHNVKS